MSDTENLAEHGSYLTTEDVGRKMRRHPRTIRDWIRKGCATDRGRIFLEGTRAGKSWLIHPDWLALFEHRIRPMRRTDLDLE